MCFSRLRLRTGPFSVNDYFPAIAGEKGVGARGFPVIEFSQYRPREVVESSEKNRLGAAVLVALAIYVAVLAFATVDDLAGWHLLWPLFGQ